MKLDDAVSMPFTPGELDPTLYTLKPAELEFFKFQTGIQDDDLLKAHILDIQAKAYKVFPYPFIHFFGFTNLRISRIPAYSDFLQLGQERDGAIFLDYACCFGNDARKAVTDGYTVENVVVADLRREFWDLGREMFKSSPDTFTVPFIASDIFDPALIGPTSPYQAQSPSTSPTTAPSLSSLTSLVPLQGHVSALHASYFFHLFDEAEQLHAARALASLLSPEPGSMIFGMHVSQPERGFRATRLPSWKSMFCHSPQSWRELWDGVVFRKGSVSVEAELHEVFRKDLAAVAPPGTKFYEMAWCVKRC